MSLGWERCARTGRSLDVTPDTILTSCWVGCLKILKLTILSGYDVLLDCHMKPHLLEVNSRPSIYTEPLDLAVNAPLVQELFSIVGFHLPSTGMNQSTLKVAPHWKKWHGFEAHFNIGVVQKIQT